MPQVRFAAWLAIVMVLSARAPAVAQSNDAENFYRAHSISMIIGFGVGGGYDLYGRLISRFIGKYLPGNPGIIPQNMTGAGSLRSVNYLYSIAPKDGSIIGTFSRTLVLAPLLNGADFDSRKFTWLGSVAQDVVVCFTAHTSPIRTWSDFLSTPSALGGEGATAEPDIYALFMKNVFGAKVKLVSGYRGTNDIFWRSSEESSTVLVEFHGRPSEASTRTGSGTRKSMSSCRRAYGNTPIYPVCPSSPS
jgi:tripartite-type tricarboxylate transporter receptor subunit TctC